MNILVQVSIFAKLQQTKSYTVQSINIIIKYCSTILQNWDNWKCFFAKKST